MKGKGIIASLMIIFITLLWVRPVQAEPPQVHSRAVVLMDGASGEILYGLEPHKRRAPASTTKIMTALLALERGDLGKTVQVSKHSGWTDIGSGVGLSPGDELTRYELLKAALIVSANDAAVAIAEDIGGSEPAFAQEMNRKAAALGAYDTNFVNANGYSKPDHYSTAYDLAVITRAAMTNPEFAALVRTQEAVIHWENKDKQVTIQNTNRLLWSYPGIIGVKTGTTSAAGECLVAAAERDGWRLIAVVLGSSQRFNDSTRLLDYGFNNFHHLLISARQLYQAVPVAGGKTESVTLVAANKVEYTCPRTEMGNLVTRVEPVRPYTAPIKEGERLAELVVTYQGQEVGRTDLVAGAAVEKLPWWGRILKWFRDV